MKLTERVLFLFKTVWNDLFGEESEVRQAITGDLTADRLTGVLDEAQQHLDALRLELASALARQHRITHTWQETLIKIQSLQAKADQALEAGQDEEARTLLEQANPLEKGANEMAALVQTCEQHTSEIRAAINQQQEQLDALRRRALLLADRESSLSTLTELFGTQQSLTRQTDKMQNELAAWEEQIARREDQLAARREWSK
jgi:phage shock protein A